MCQPRLAEGEVMNKPCSLFLIILIFCSWVARAQTTPTASVIKGEKGRKIDELMRAYYRERLLNGTVLVAERGKVIYKRGFGLANMEFKVPNDANTKFRLASIAKPLVATLTMRLVEQGKLSLDSKVSDFLLDYRKDVADKVTVRHLLSHTSGLPDRFGRGITERMRRDPFTREQLLDLYGSGPLEFEPGSNFKYGTVAYILMSLIIEKATGKTFEHSLHDNLLAVAGMNDTGVEGRSPIVFRNEQGNAALVGDLPVMERLATGYIRIGDHYSRPPLMDMSHGNTGGTMHSTVEDLFRLDRALHSGKLLSKHSEDVMYTPIQSDTALGWNVRYLSFADLQQPFLNLVDRPRTLREAPADLKIIYKTGDLWGYTGVFARFPNEGHVIVVFFNVNNRGILADLNTIRITQGAASILYGKPYFTPRERMFANIIERQGFDKAVETFEQLRRKEPNSLILRESEFNALGYEFLERSKTAQAVNIFKLNVRAFPVSANAYDSLAEAYMRNGERRLAIENYQKSLDLNPRNTGAIEMLKILKEP